MKLKDRRLSRKGDLKSKFQAFADKYREDQHAIPQGQGPQVVEEVGTGGTPVGGRSASPVEAEGQEQEAAPQHDVAKPAPRKRKVPSKKG